MKHLNNPVEVVLLSRNDPDTGLRVFNSAHAYGLGITRGAFVSGQSPYRYIASFHASLFLSANAGDVELAIRERAPAGQVLDSSFNDDPNDSELRIAFDFDGVLADDSAEQVYKSEGLVGFQTLEQSNSSRPHQKGPLHGLIMKLAKLQQLELKHKTRHPSYEPTLRTAIITARNAPAHKRFVTTLRDWGLNVNETFFLGGIDKNRILEVLRPHIFFDDQLTHVRPAAGVVPAVHVPFGVANSKVAAAKNVKTKRS